MDKIQKRNALVGKIRSAPMSIRAEESEDENTLNFIIVSNKNDGERYNWGTGEFYTERLSISGANLEELNTFFKDHKRGVDDAIGHISRKSVDEVVRASVTFDDDGFGVKRKYKNKTLRDVSVGYVINDYKVEKREGDTDLVTVTDYTILELSAVGIGFDTGAKHERSQGIDEKTLAEVSKRLDAVALKLN